MKTKHVLSVYLLSRSKEDLQTIANAVIDADSLFVNSIVTGDGAPTLNTDKLDLWGELFDTAPPDMVIIGGVANDVVKVETNEADDYYYGLSLRSVFDSENLHFAVKPDTDAGTIETVPCLCTFIGAEMWQRLLDRPGMQSISVFGSAYTPDPTFAETHEKWKIFDYQLYGSTDDPNNLDTLSLVGKYTPQTDEDPPAELPFSVPEMKAQPWIFFPLLPGEGKALAGIAMWQSYVDWKLGGADTPQVDMDELVQAMEQEQGETPAELTVTEAIEALMDGVAAAINEGTATFTEEGGNVTVTLDGPVGDAIVNLTNGIQELQGDAPIEEDIEYEPVTWNDDTPWLDTLGMGPNYIRCGVLMANGSSCTNVGTSVPGKWKTNTFIARLCNRHSAMTMTPTPKMQKKNEEDENKDELAKLDAAAQALEQAAALAGMTIAEPHVVTVQNPFHLDNTLHGTANTWTGFTTHTFTTTAPPIMPTWVPEMDDDIHVGPDPWGQVYDKLSDELTDLLVGAISQADNGGALDTDLLILTQSTIDILKPLLLAMDQAKGAEVLFVMTSVMMNLENEVDA